MRVLVIGSGGREHALAWKLAQSPRCSAVIAAPGNPGIAAVAQCVPVGADDLDGLRDLCRTERIDLAVVGPEVPLVAGLADLLRADGVAVFGPGAGAALIEGSKAYAKQLMVDADVPTAAYRRFTDLPAARAYLEELQTAGVAAAVVKASGLAAGKGAIVCDTLVAAHDACQSLLEEGSLGDAGREIVIEECLSGQEASLLVITDGERAAPCVAAQDYKRVGEGDTGPNTGGMGSYAPAPLITPALYVEALNRIVHPTLRALAADDRPYSGCLYAGVMLTDRGLQVIEFNCRFGDPETQAVLPLLESDLLDLLYGSATGNLDPSQVRWSGQKAVCVVLTSGGYPGDFRRGLPISGIEAAAAHENVLVFHAGTAIKDGQLVTNGGRVLNVVGLGATFREAKARAYRAAEQIEFEGVYYRADIAERVLEPV